MSNADASLVEGVLCLMVLASRRDLAAVLCDVLRRIFGFGASSHESIICLVDTTHYIRVLVSMLITVVIQRLIDRLHFIYLFYYYLFSEEKGVLGF